MADDTYNGWKNRETWAAALHLSNDQGLYNWATELVRDEAESISWGDVIDGQDDPKVIHARICFRAGERIAEQVDEWATDLFHPDPDAPMAWRADSAILMMLDEIGSRWRVDWTVVAASFADEDGE